MTRSMLVALIACVAIVVGAWLGATERASPVSPESSQATTAPTHTIEVHVAGWVDSPGVVQLSEGSLVVEAIEAAGGLRPGARAEGINLAAQVQDGEQILVPGPEGAGVQEGTADGVIALNRANAAELEQLPGVGPVLAARIVAHREENGPFGEVEDLLDVPGIGESKLGALSDLVRVP